MQDEEKDSAGALPEWDEKKEESLEINPDVQKKLTESETTPVSVSLRSKKSGLLQVELKGIYDKKMERKKLLKITFQNLGFVGKQGIQEGFLFHGLDLNPHEFQGLMEGCAVKYVFYFAKFFLMQKAIKTEEVTTSDWMEHKYNLDEPEIVDFGLEDTTQKKEYALFGPFWVTTTVKIRAGILGSCLLLQDNDNGCDDILSLRDFGWSKAEKYARYQVIRRLHKLGKYDALKKFAIRQLSKFPQTKKDLVETDSTESTESNTDSAEDGAKGSEEEGENSNSEDEAKRPVSGTKRSFSSSGSALAPAPPAKVTRFTGPLHASPPKEENNKETKEENKEETRDDEGDENDEGAFEEGTAAKYETQIKTMQNVVGNKLSKKEAYYFVLHAGGDIQQALDRYYKRQSDETPDWLLMYLHEAFNSEEIKESLEGNDKKVEEKVEVDEEKVEETGLETKDDEDEDDDGEDTAIDVAPPLKTRRKAERKTIKEKKDDTWRYRGITRCKTVKKAFDERKKKISFRLQNTWLLVLVFAICAIVLRFFIVQWLLPSFPALQFHNRVEQIGIATLVLLLIAEQSLFHKQTRCRSAMLFVVYFLLSLWICPSASPSAASAIVYSVWVLIPPAPQKNDKVRAYQNKHNKEKCLPRQPRYLRIILPLMLAIIFVCIGLLSAENLNYFVVAFGKSIFSLGSFYVEHRSGITCAEEILFAPVRDSIFLLTCFLGLIVLAEGGG